MDIDFVILWVDGADKEWQRKKSTFSKKSNQDDAARFRDWNLLRYWFRAVEYNAPWVHKIYFVTDSQCPAWLNVEHPKLCLIDHKDYIPEAYLPTFNSNCIEFNFHRIKGLSEHFVAFNDDMFINNPITPEYYFHEGLPCDAPMEHLFTGSCYDKEDKWGISISEFCDTHIVNAHFDRKEVIKNNFKGWYGWYLGFKYLLQGWIIYLFKRSDFQHFYTQHNEKPFLKSVYEEVWRKEPEILADSCTRFREYMNLNIYLFRYWQLASNKFYPTKLQGKEMIPISEQNMGKIHKALFNPEVKSLCLNDSTFCEDSFFEEAKTLLVKWFEEKLPNKSSFEI